MPELEKELIAIQNADDANLVFQVFANAGQAYGFNNACFTLMNDHLAQGLGKYHGFATDYPEDWMDYYMERNYLDCDPVIYKAIRGGAAFVWSEAITAQNRDQKLDPKRKASSRILMSEAADAGLVDGVGIPLFTQGGGLSAVGLSTNDEELDIPPETLAEVSLLAGAFHERFLSFFNREQPVHITSREIDVLSWSAEGKTDSEIAQLLGVSVATVRFHWGNIFRKFNAANKVNATAKAIRLNLVSVSLLGVPEIWK
ncbi:LuxR family transcriptional regulator [Labrenzia sp. PHM005]|uniref:helix-turn-helix transcriptional regulator n=1 Tax=Labrenzia sp. PHM005 TaxID=2590016 RepID=UPI00114018F9|nr:LuxR family transcriptional regulator [Labrenzia sp. PHM005]QDG76505.1 LuxR family transcriptional regulator [Labrenzia sp. PHM005]